MISKTLNFQCFTTWYKILSLACLHIYMYLFVHVLMIITVNRYFHIWLWYSVLCTQTMRLFTAFSFQPHLHVIVNRSMELAMSAKEPYNYFLLLRALFRSIGGGSHDLLYQEFLPLLPNLLQGMFGTVK